MIYPWDENQFQQQRMRKTFLREKEKAAKDQLLTIDEEESAREWGDAYDPLRAQACCQIRKRSNIKKKVKTEVSSPRRSLKQNYRQELKQNLERLQKQSVGIQEAEEDQEHERHEESKTRPLILRSLNLNENSGIRIDKHIFRKKQRSEQKMRPLVIIDNQKEEEEEEKIRSLIKRKIHAKDIFRRIKCSKNENGACSQIKLSAIKKGEVLSKIYSEKRGLKKNLIFQRPRNYLPYIL